MYTLNYIPHLPVAYICGTKLLVASFFQVTLHPWFQIYKELTIHGSHGQQKEIPRKLKKQWRGLVPWSLHLEWAVDLFSKSHGLVVGEMVKHRWRWMIETKSCLAIAQKPVYRYIPMAPFQPKFGCVNSFYITSEFSQAKKNSPTPMLNVWYIYPIISHKNQPSM